MKYVNISSLWWQHCEIILHFSWRVSSSDRHKWQCDLWTTRNSTFCRFNRHLFLWQWLHIGQKHHAYLRVCQ